MFVKLYELLFLYKYSVFKFENILIKDYLIIIMKRKDLSEIFENPSKKIVKL
jgi:hypothetical protein